MLVRTRLLTALAALAGFLTALAPAAWAQEFPTLTGRVVDAANVIPAAQEDALTQKLAALEAQSQRQFVIATLPDLQGYDIADYGYRLGREWGIGSEDRDDGVLLIVAPKERKVRIEVGYGLEPVLTDGLSFLIINQQILPRFKAGDLPGGIEAGADAIIRQITLPEEEAKAIAAQANSQPQASPRQGLNLFDFIFLGVFFLFFVLPILRALRGGRRYRRGGVPIIMWNSPGWGGGSSGGFGGGGFGGGGGFSGGGGSFGGGGASGSW